MCGSLSIVAGGLSLLFPACWRRPLPNTLEEAENRRLIPLKERYPSFRDLKNGKINSIPGLGVGVNGNVYTIPPNNYDKTQVKQADDAQSDINQNAINNQSNGNVYKRAQNGHSINHQVNNHHCTHQLRIDGITTNVNNACNNANCPLALHNSNRPSALYNDDDSRLSDLEEEINDSNNWRLYSHDFSIHRPENHVQLIRQDSQDVNRSLRDLHVFSRPSLVANAQTRHSIASNGGCGTINCTGRSKNQTCGKISETNL